MVDKFNFGELRKGRNLKNGSDYSSLDREIAVMRLILHDVMTEREPTYVDFALSKEFIGVGTNFLGRYCNDLDRGSVKKTGDTPQTTKILATAENAAKAFRFLKEKAPATLEEAADQLGLTVDQLFNRISEWLDAGLVSPQDSDKEVEIMPSPEPPNSLKGE